jgi:hypothetical protein
MARTYQQGEEGEAWTAELLEQLPTAFRSLHDRAIPGSRANIDHIVVGPTGVFMVDSKNFHSRISLSKGTLWCGRHPMTEKLRKALWESEEVEHATATQPSGYAMPVTPVLCIHGSPVPDDLIVGGVHVLAPERLLSFLVNRPQLMQAHEALELTAVIRRALRPYVRGERVPEASLASPAEPPMLEGTPASVEPAPPQRPPAATGQPPHGPPRRSTGSPAPRPAPRQRPPAPGRRSTTPTHAGRTLRQAAIGLAAILIGLVTLTSTFKSPARTPLPAVGGPVAGSGAPAPPVGTLDLSKGRMVCETATHSWSLIFDGVDPSGYDVTWTDRPDGAYVATAASANGAWAPVRNIPASTRVFLRARPTGATSDTYSAVMYKAPDSAC